jgi:hypothetical protein
MSVADVNNLKPTQAVTSLSRFIPEPKSSRAFSWSNVLTKLTETAAQGVTGAYSGEMNLNDLLTQQMAMQREMMIVSMISNVERTKHETQMAPVRNMRVA